MAKVKAKVALLSDPVKFAAVRDRVREFHGNHVHYAADDRYIRVCGSFIAELDWLGDEVERLAGEDGPKHTEAFAQARGFIADVVRNHGPEVDRGSFVRVGGHIVTHAMWLVNEAERLLGERPEFTTED